MPDLIRHPEKEQLKQHWIPDQVRNDKTANVQFSNYDTASQPGIQKL
jgi:hypothetical protein